jgi:hypothetical protein
MLHPHIKVANNSSIKDKRLTFLPPFVKQSKANLLLFFLILRDRLPLLLPLSQELSLNGELVSLLVSDELLGAPSMVCGTVSSSFLVACALPSLA